MCTFRRENRPSPSRGDVREMGDMDVCHGGFPHDLVRLELGLDLTGEVSAGIISD